MIGTSLETILKLFEGDELDLLIRRLDDQPWSVIAVAVGGTAEGAAQEVDAGDRAGPGSSGAYTTYSIPDGRGRLGLRPEGTPFHEW